MRKLSVIRSVAVPIFLRYTPSKRSELLWVEKFMTSENTVSDYLQTTNVEFLDMFLTAKHLEGCSDKTIRYYRCNIEKMLDMINIPIVKITTEMLRKYLVEHQSINNCNNFRDRAMIDFLLSTGIHVGELVRLNIDDIDFTERECVVRVFE